MDTVYRDGSEGARRKLGELWLERVEQVAGLSDMYRRIYARRVARTAAGGVMAVAGLAMLVWAAVLGVQQSLFHGGADGALTWLLLHTWVAAAAAYVLAGAWARRQFDWHIAQTLAPTGDLYADLERARHEAPGAVAVGLASRRERVSVALPLIGLSLILPLTLHLLFFWLVGDNGLDTEAFDSWIVTSALLVGHSHLVLAVCAWFYAGEATRTGPARGRQAWGPWMWAVCSSAVPGIVFLGFPVFIVAITGVFIPILFPSLAARARGERTTVGAPVAA